jgi:hypothetical protein
MFSLRTITIEDNIDLFQLTFPRRTSEGTSGDFMYMVKKKKKRVPIIISDLITKTASSIQ